MEDIIISYRQIREGFLNPSFNVVKASAESDISITKIYQMKREIKDGTDAFEKSVQRLPLYKLVGLQKYFYENKGVA